MNRSRLLSCGCTATPVPGIDTLNERAMFLGWEDDLIDDPELEKEGLEATSEVEIADLRNVVANQGIVERIFGLGSVGLSTAGQSGFEVRMRGIRDPQKVVMIIKDQKKQQAAAPAS